MPRIVDHRARRRQIARTAMELIADEGTRGLSIRSIAARLGGSMTLVTHYYPTRGALLLDLVTQLSSTWQDELDRLLEGVASPRDAITRTLRWLLPLDEEGQREERARFQILATRDEPECLNVLYAFDENIRAVLRQQLRALLPADEAERALDVLRATTDGISLAYHTRPDAWAPERQIATLGLALERLLGPDEAAPDG